MRRLVTALAAVIALAPCGLIATSSPAAAAPLPFSSQPCCPTFPPPFPPPLSISRTPIGGGPGTKVKVTGQCAAPTGSASLERITFSDGRPGPADTQQFTVRADHTFQVTLTNPYGKGDDFGGPIIDVQIGVTCAGQFAWLPFHASPTPSANTPTVFTALGDGACGQGFVPAGTDPSIPCPAIIKGFNGSGSLAKTNFAENGWPQGASVATYTADNQLRLVVGTGPGVPAGFSLADVVGNTLAGVATYGPSFMGGAMVAAGDVTGDGQPDIVIAPGRGGGPHVKVFSDVAFGANNFYEVSGFMAYAPNFTGGVTVAVGDVNGDGVAEIITGAGAGGGPHVRVFDWQGNEKSGFMAYSPDFHGGVNVAAGDLAGDGRAEVVTGAGPAGGPHVRVFDQGGNEVAGFMAYGSNMNDGVFVAVGHALSGFTRNIVTGPGAGADPHVKVLSYRGEEVANPWPGGFLTYTRSFHGGVRVAVAP